MLIAKVYLALYGEVKVDLNLPDGLHSKRHGSTVSTATFRIGILFEGVA